MFISRRSFCCGLAVFPTTIDIAGAQAIIETTPPLPRPAMFEAGDLLWPKKPGVFVPYSQQIGTGPARDRQIWEQEKQEFLDRAVRGHTSMTSEQIADLRRLDYREFVARYHGDQKPGEPGVYSSGGGLYVGHVALGQPVVIEALWDKGVRSSYKDWISGRPDEIVWLGRLRNDSKSERAGICSEAVKFLGRPYDFWNFDLNDDSGFYCSKLVWLSIYRRLGFAVDGDQNPKRGFWFSPKQLLYLPTIRIIHDPGPYATH